MTGNRTSIWIGLAISVFLHLLGVLFWWTAPGARAVPETKQPALVVQLLPLVLRVQEAPKSQAEPAPAVPKPAPASKQKSFSLTVPSPSPAIVMPAAPVERNDPPASPPAAALSVDDMLQNAMRDIGKIDRDLRKAFPRLPEAAPASIQSKLEKGIAAAARTGSVGQEELTLQDGRKMTKITGPGGAVCIYKESNVLTGGRDVIKDGVRTMVTTCP